MKAIKTILIFFIFSIYSNANAQSKQPEQIEIIIPKFQAEMLVLRTLEAVEYFKSTLTISDGSSVKFSLQLKPIRPENNLDNAESLAIVINQLKKQGYKLISSNSGGAGTKVIIVATYIFQKE